MSPPRELGDGTDRDVRVRDTTVDEPRCGVVLAQRLDAMAAEAHQARQELSAVAGHVRALRQEVDDLRAAAAELLRRTAPVEKAPAGRTGPKDSVYLAAGVAVAVVAVLLTIYLFTRT